MASNEHNSNSNSPMHLGLTGQFSPEDIQELLGVMGDGSDHHHGDAQGNSLMAQTSDGYSHHAPGLGGEPNSTAATSSESSKQAGATCQGAPITSTGPTASAGSVASNQPGEEAKVQARSERKRSREKQRRSDVNKQFADLTQLLQKIDAEDVNEEDVKNGTTSNRVTFNPSNRVDLIARTIVLLERLHEANKRRKTEIGSLQQQLDEAKKAGEDTAAKLKEAMLAPPGQPMNKQIMMMVPMMMSADGTGSTAAVPMMNPYMPQAPMQQAFCPMPTQHMAAPVAVAQQPQAMAAAPGAASSASVAAHAQSGNPQQQQQAQQQQTAQPPAVPFPYMMHPQMAGGGFMMPMPTAGGHAMAGQQMAMVQQPMGAVTMQQGTPAESQQEQKDSSPGLSGGSNLAHCA